MLRSGKTKTISSLKGHIPSWPVANEVAKVDARLNAPAGFRLLINQ
jgi:hypothetical protein